MVDLLTSIGKRKNATPAQIALAWLLAQGDDVIPIPGTNHAANLEQNVAAVDVVLTPAEVKQLGNIFAPGAGAGARYTPGALKGVWL